MFFGPLMMIIVVAAIVVVVVLAVRWLAGPAMARHTFPHPEHLSISSRSASHAVRSIRKSSKTGGACSVSGVFGATH